MLYVFVLKRRSIKLSKSKADKLTIGPLEHVHNNLVGPGFEVKTRPEYTANRSKCPQIFRGTLGWLPIARSHLYTNKKKKDAALVVSRGGNSIHYFFFLFFSLSSWARDFLSLIDEIRVAGFPWEYNGRDSHGISYIVGFNDASRVTYKPRVASETNRPQVMRGAAHIVTNSLQDPENSTCIVYSHRAGIGERVPMKEAIHRHCSRLESIR